MYILSEGERQATLISSQAQVAEQVLHSSFARNGQWQPKADISDVEGFKLYAFEGNIEGSEIGVFEESNIEGIKVEDFKGDIEGCKVVAFEGNIEGSKLGDFEVAIEGSKLGTIEGNIEGSRLGPFEGSIEGCRPAISDGEDEGF